MKGNLTTKKGPVGAQGKDTEGIRNPFEEFDTFTLKKTQIPLDQIIESFNQFELEVNGAELHEKYYGMADRLVQECVR